MKFVHNNARLHARTTTVTNFTWGFQEDEDVRRGFLQNFQRIYDDGNIALDICKATQLGLDDVPWWCEVSCDDGKVSNRSVGTTRGTWLLYLGWCATQSPTLGGQHNHRHWHTTQLTYLVLVENPNLVYQQDFKLYLDDWFYFSNIHNALIFIFSPNENSNWWQHPLIKG